jgi:hypothetical protein
MWLNVALLCLAALPYRAQSASLYIQGQGGQSQDQSQSQDDKQKDKTKDQEKKSGKSKIEQETGTVNDRIMAVMPNYTVEQAKELPAMTTAQKYRLAAAQGFDSFAFPFNAALAGIDQANNSPKSWGQGWGAYGQRFGSNFADNTIGTFMTTAVFPSLLHEDPRYYQMAKGPFLRRTYHAINRLFVTRTDSGGTQCNYSELAGNAAAAAFSNVYHAPEDRTFSRNIGTFGLLIMWDGVGNLMKEFWPDVRRKVFHKRSTDQ